MTHTLSICQQRWVADREECGWKDVFGRDGEKEGWHVLLDVRKWKKNKKGGGAGRGGRVLITTAGYSSCTTENIKYHFVYHCTCMLEVRKLIQTWILGTKVVNRVGLRARLQVYGPWFLVGHDGERPREPQSEAKMRPRGQG